MLQKEKPYSKTLRQLCKPNADHREASLSFQRSLSTHKQLPPLNPLLKNRSNSQKIRTEPGEQSEPIPQIRPFNQQTSFSQQVDTLMLQILQENQVGKDIKEQLKQRRRNMRVVTENNEHRPTHKRSQASSQLDQMMVRKEVSRQRLLRQKYLQQNPQVEKKVSTRWGINQKKGPYSRELLAYYPLAAFRQETHQILQSIPARSEEYLRKLRQTALNRLQ